MMVENLKLCYNLIKNENYQTINYWTIINSSQIFLKPLKIDEFINIYPMDCINTELNVDLEDSIRLNPFIQRINYYKGINGQFGHHYYLLDIKIISIKDEKIKKIVSGMDIEFILDDLLCILSLYYNRYFMIFQIDIFFDYEISEKYRERIKKSGINFADIDISSKDITNNFNILCNLRQEQFYLIEKSMKLYSNSLYTNETNPSIALCFLISSIEVLAQKYIKLDDNWENYSDLNFYKSLEKCLKEITDINLREKLFKKIGQKYIKDLFQVKTRFKEFLLRFVDRKFRFIEDANDKLFKELAGDYYDLRSLYIHSGTEILSTDYKHPIVFNKTIKGKLKTYNEGSRLDIRFLPSFQFLIIIIKSSIFNFIDYLYFNRDNEQDKQKYDSLDKRTRGTIEVTAKEDIPVHTLVFGPQIHMKDQYIHLYERSEQIEIYKNNNDYAKLIDEHLKIKEKIIKSTDYERIAQNYNDLGTHYLENNNLEQGISNLLEAKKISEKNKFNHLLDFIHYNLACYYSLKNNLEKSIEFLNNAIKNPKLKEIAKTDKHLENLRNDSRFNNILTK